MTRSPPCGGSSKRRNCPGRNISTAKVGRTNLLRAMEFSASRRRGWWISAAICERPMSLRLALLALRGTSVLCSASRSLRPHEPNNGAGWNKRLIHRPGSGCPVTTGPGRFASWSSGVWLAMDEDIERFTRDELIAEVKKLRAGIRDHRDSSKHELCWHHPQLWGLLPEKLEPEVAVPAWPQFLRGCLRYRESLDAQLPNAPRVTEEFDGASGNHTMPS
jgi:hypothetical protein